MNLIELKKELSKKFSDKNIILRFTEKCKKRIDISLIDGNPALSGHIVYGFVQVEIEGQPTQLVKIQPHRQEMSFSKFKEMINSMKEAHISDDILEEIAKLDENDQGQEIKNLSENSMIKAEVIHGKIAEVQSRLKNKKEIPLIMD